MEQTKVCTKCGEKKPLSGFYKSKGGKYGRGSVCVACTSKKNLEYNARPEVKAKRKEYNSSPEFKLRNVEYQRKHRSTPEAKAKQKEYNSRPDVKLRKVEHQRRYMSIPENRLKRAEKDALPEEKARKRARDSKPEVIARKKAYDKTPEGKARKRKHHNLPETKAKAKERRALPEVKASARARGAERKRGVRNQKIAKAYRTEIAETYKSAALCKELTGVEFHVDHICPLKARVFDPDFGELQASGVHAPWNLRFIRAEDNISRLNRVTLEEILRPTF